MTAFRSDKCRAFLEHWQRLRDLRAGEHAVMPSQADFFDQADPVFAPYLHVAEIAGDALIFKLMGTALVERWGRDKTGEIIGLDQPEVIRQALVANAKTASAVPCGFRLIIEFAASNGSELQVEAVVLPLAVPEGAAPRLVSYSDLLQKIKFGDHSERYLGLPEVDWIDIGARVPETRPQTVARLR